MRFFLQTNLGQVLSGKCPFRQVPITNFPLKDPKLPSIPRNIFIDQIDIMFFKMTIKVCISDDDVDVDDDYDDNHDDDDPDDDDDDDNDDDPDNDDDDDDDDHL